MPPNGWSLLLYNLKPLLQINSLALYLFLLLVLLLLLLRLLLHNQRTYKLIVCDVCHALQNRMSNNNKNIFFDLIFSSSLTNKFTPN